MIGRFILCAFCIFTLSVNAQIHFQNPSFEGDPCVFCLPPNWIYCDYHVATVNPDSPTYIPAPQKIVDGKTYVILQRLNPPNEDGDAVQKLNCTVQKGKSYEFSLSSCAWGCYNSGCFIEKGRLIVSIGDSCLRKCEIYKSGLLDTFWSRQSVKFKSCEDYAWITFSAEYDTNTYVNIAIDALSPIYLINANAVHVAYRDTVIYTQSHEQVCVHLQATSDISTYDTVRWYRLNDTIKTPVAVGFSTTQCIDSSTTFLIGMRDSVVGCAGVEWSWDTVRVWVRDTLLGIDSRLESNAVNFNVSPNPVVSEFIITPTFEEPYDFSVYDALGRICLTGAGRKETVVDADRLSKGVYVVRVGRMMRRLVVE